MQVLVGIGLIKFKPYKDTRMQWDSQTTLLRIHSIGEVGYICHFLIVRGYVVRDCKYSIKTRS